MTVGDLSEADLIARIRARLAPPPPWLLVGIGDDAAVVEPERNRAQVLSVDAIVDGVHFDRRFTPADAIGHRALAVNLSDLAAMGATPRLALMSLVLPVDLPCTDFDDIVDGLATLASAHRLHVVGGNLTRTAGPLVVDVTIVGGVKRRDAMTRGGARAGDVLYLTGTIGAAAAGLDMLRSGAGDGDPCAARYLRPHPRVRAGVLLGRNRAATACMDLSDGLGDAVRQVAGASGVGARVDAAALPLDPHALAWAAGQPERFPDRLAVLTWAVSAGDDYELLAAVPPRRDRLLRAVARQAGLPFTRIGVCTPAQDVTLVHETQELMMPPGYSHFR